MTNVKTEKARILKVIDRYSFVVIIDSTKLKMSASISRTMKAYEEKELNVGDSVIVDYSPFDLTRGRIHHLSFAMM